MEDVRNCPLALRGNPGVFARLWFAGGAPRRFVRCSCRVFLILRGCPGIFASGVSVALARGRIGGVTVRGGSGFVRSVMGCPALGGLGGEPLGFGTTLPGPGRRWLSLSVRRRCWGWRVASPGRRRLRLGRWLSAAVALVTWRLARSLHFVACRWHGRSTPEQQSSGAAGRRNGAATWAPGRWSVGALGCWSPGAAESRNVGAVGRQSCGVPE